jgi:hypothetical protein
MSEFKAMVLREVDGGKVASRVETLSETSLPDRYCSRLRQRTFGINSCQRHERVARLAPLCFYQVREALG